MRGTVGNVSIENTIRQRRILRKYAYSQQHCGCNTQNSSQKVHLSHCCFKLKVIVGLTLLLTRILKDPGNIYVVTYV
jgi:hypothetical protein